MDESLRSSDLTPTEVRPVVVAFQRFGPYHRARLSAAADRMPVVGLELGTIDEYAWKYEPAPKQVEITTAFPGENPDLVSPSRFSTTIRAILGEIGPSAIAVPGWGQRSALSILRIAKRCGIPTVLMSDSTIQDTRRYAVKELIKSKIVQYYDSALVAGSPQKEYLCSLGFAPERIFLGYNVVDNAHFESAAVNSGYFKKREFRRSFLVVSRFIKRKNLDTLVIAFIRYAASSESNDWSLRIIGDGPERLSLERLIRSSAYADRIRLDGFLQYEELPLCYAAAGCFILPSLSDQWGLVVNEAMASGLPVLVSERCGCAIDLVKEGLNGFTFDPTDVEQLAKLMARISSNSFDIERLGEASRRCIANWNLDRFVLGLESAVRAVDVAQSQRFGILGDFALSVLARR